MIASFLLVEPEVFETLAIVDAVDHQRRPLQGRPLTDRAVRKEDDRPGIILDQLPLDLPDQFACASQHRSDRLLIDQLIDFRVAVAGIVARCTARTCGSCAANRSAASPICAAKLRSNRIPATHLRFWPGPRPRGFCRGGHGACLAGHSLEPARHYYDRTRSTRDGKLYRTRIR